jgi:hypothetical protein
MTNTQLILAALRSRTVQFSIALAVLSLLQGFVVQLPIPAWGHAVIGSVVAVCIVILRAITTQPLTQR